MTRHGTLAYYLAAWVIGCPVAALLFWLRESLQSGSASSAALLEICFFALMSGAIDSLLLAFLVRRLMRGLGARHLALWAIAGAALSFGIVFLLASASARLPGGLGQGPGYFLSAFLFTGPAAIWTSGWWQAPVDGVCIGAVLSLVDRAFNREDAMESSGSAGNSASPAQRGETTAAQAGHTSA